jgi:hypothetical protein
MTSEIDYTPGAEVYVDGDGIAKVVSKSGSRVRVEFDDGRKVWRVVSQIKPPDYVPGSEVAPAPAPAPAPATPRIPKAKKSDASGGDDFKVAVAALKEAATKDAKYKKADDDEKPALLPVVISLYEAAESKLDAAINGGNVKGTVKSALEGKLETVIKRVAALKSKADSSGAASTAGTEDAVDETTAGVSDTAPAAPVEPAEAQPSEPHPETESAAAPAMDSDIPEAVKPAAPAVPPKVPEKAAPAIPSKKAPVIPKGKGAPAIPGKSPRPAIPGTARARAGRFSSLSISLYKTVFYGAFVWVRMALNSQKRRFSDRAEGGTRTPGKESGACYSDEGKVTPDQRQRQGYRRGHRYRRGRCLRRRPGAEG